MTDNFIVRPIVQAIGLTKQVSTGSEQLTILENIHLEINAGDSVAVVGASGSGKSTLLGLLAGLDTPSSGKVHLYGEDIFYWMKMRERRCVGACWGSYSSHSSYYLP